MNLTTTEKYALAVLEAHGSLSALQKKERALCLAASCVWDMMQAKSVTEDKKGKLRIFAPLPETLSYCSPVYEMLEKKPMKPEKVPYDRIWTNKRIKTLVESIVDDLIGKSVLVVERQNSLLKSKLCHVDTTVIAEDIAAVKHPDRTFPSDQTNQAILLLESGTAKKLLNKQELSVLKKTVRQTDSDFKTYIKKVTKLFRTDRAMACVASIICLVLLTGCGNSASFVPADMSYTQANVDTIPISSDVQVVGLGEASHGVAQYHQMKADVFKALVHNNGCRTFIIEGDFGGALKVDNYINGGDGSAEEAASEIGFTIYRTQEMADLIEWMRSYNDTASSGEALHYYGMDVQGFDNNKAYLFSVLEQTVPELSAEYSESLAQLTDENRYNLDKTTLSNAKEAVSKLMNKMDAARADITELSGESTFDFARECANTIYAFCDVQLSDSYNATRDQYMYEKVDWFLQHGDGSILFINGHNGHIGKTFAGYTCLGELLSKNLGNGYYAIGTDARITRFNSTKKGGFEVVEVSNSNDLNSQLADAGNNCYFIDFTSAQSDETWKQILNSEQTITTLNVSLSGMLKIVKFAYTTKVIPQSTYDGMIVFRTVTPSTIIE